MTSYSGNASTTTLEATGTGSTLTLANLTSVTQTANSYADQTQFEALAGGTVTLSALKTINTGTVILESDGTDSVLNCGGADQLCGGQRLDLFDTASLQRRHGRRQQSGQLVQRELERLGHDQSRRSDELVQHKPDHHGTGENLTLGGLTSFNSGNITVSGGASLSLPGVTSYSGNASTTTLEATGTGSTLTLANLASVTQTANSYADQTQFEALAGGTVTLSALKTINTGTVILESDGTDSVLNVAALTSFVEANGWTYSTLQASNGGTVVDPGLSQLRRREPHRQLDRHVHHLAQPRSHDQRWNDYRPNRNFDR